MLRFKDYLLTQYKRIFKLLPGILVMILLTAILLAAAGYALINNETYLNDKQRYKLGVVGDTSNEMISLGVNMISSLDESRYMIELIEYDNEDDARNAMRSADISAYVVITEEFSNALNALTNDAKLTYYATSGQKGISNVMMDEMALVATNIIVSSETGICTLRELMNEGDYDKTFKAEHIDELFMKYIMALMNRNEVSIINELGLSDGLSTPSYYFIGILLFFMLLLSFCSISFFLGQQDALYKFIRAKGLNATSQILAEYVSFLTLNIIVALIIMGVISIVGNLDIFNFKYLGIYGLGDFFGFTARLILVCVMFSSLGFLIFEGLVGVINKILVAFMLYIGMGYISGYFYPKTFFPDMVQKPGEILPSGVAFSILSSFVTDDSGTAYFIEMILYSMVFLGLSVFFRNRKIS